MPRSTNKPIVNNSAIQNRPPSNQQPSLFSSIKQGFDTCRYNNYEECATILK